MTITYDTKSFVITVSLTADEASLLAQGGITTGVMQDQFSSWVQQVASQNMERDKITIRSAIDTATSDQLQAAKTALGIS